MTNKKIYFAIGLSLFCLLLAYVYIYRSQVAKEEKEILAQKNKLTITVNIDYSQGKIETKKQDFDNANRPKPYTALEALKELYVVDSIQYDWGVSIKCINNKCEDKDAGDYWFFWQNDKFSAVAIDKYYLRDKDTITIKYLNSKEVGM